MLWHKVGEERPEPMQKVLLVNLFIDGWHYREAVFRHDEFTQQDDASYVITGWKYWSDEQITPPYAP